MSINSLSSSSAVLTIYLHTHISTLNSVLLHFATLVNVYLTKSLPHITQNFTILGKTILYFFHYAGNFCLLCWHYAQCFYHPIMLKIMRLKPNSYTVAIAT